MKPAGYSTVSPYLVVESAQGVIDFLKEAFGAVELRRYDDGEGGIVHAEVRLDDSVIMLTDAGPDWPPVPAWIHVYVDDVDAVFERALAAGATTVHEPREQEGDPDRRAGVKGPGGITWFMATQLPGE